MFAIAIKIDDKVCSNKHDDVDTTFDVRTTRLCYSGTLREDLFDDCVVRVRVTCTKV